MGVENSYDQWARQYDLDHNKTRDLEGLALREILAGARPARILEIGCGTGKNTIWLQGICDELVSVDLSAEMLAVARQKVSHPHVKFVRADITGEWDFAQGQFDLVTFSLVLEHIEDLRPVFAKLAAVLNPGGQVYIGELHPFKQYGGSKARFTNEQGLQVVDCFTHHISDFTNAAVNAGLGIKRVEEFFDNRDRSGVPRLAILVFEGTGNSG